MLTSQKTISISKTSTHQKSTPTHPQRPYKPSQRRNHKKHFTQQKQTSRRHKKQYQKIETLATLPSGVIYSAGGGTRRPQIALGVDAPFLSRFPAPPIGAANATC